METTEKPVSLLALKGFLAIWWWGLIVGGIAALVFLAAAEPTDVDFAMTGYASGVSTESLSAVDRHGTELKVEFEDPVRLKLLLPNEEGDRQLKAGHKVISVLLVIPFFLANLYFVKQLRDIVRTVDQGNPFDAENARRARIIGGLIVAYVVLESIGRLAMSGYADTMVKPAGFDLNGRIEVSWGLLIVGCTVIVLSEVFRHGAILREEQSLTV